VSQESPPKARDRWEEALEQALKELKTCQQSRQIVSCLSCEEIVGCQLRNHYVNAVYESMNKGTGGGFEF